MGFNSTVAGGDANPALNQNAGGGWRFREYEYLVSPNHRSAVYKTRAINPYANRNRVVIKTAPADQYSLAAGRQAKANHTVTFIWADSRRRTSSRRRTTNSLCAPAAACRFRNDWWGISPQRTARVTASSTNALSLNNPGNAFAGTFPGNGAGLTNLNAWKLDGNAGTTAGVNFLGTSDNNP
jgi:hypothetical protein